VTNKKTTKKLGRPKLPKGAAKGKIVPVRLSDEELKLFTKAANKSEHKTLSGWIRHSLMEAATR
jgi:hypothetical protein